MVDSVAEPSGVSDLAHLRGELAAQKDHNDRLISTLRDAREQIVTLKAEVDRLAEPPSGFGSFMFLHEDGSVDIVASGKKLRVSVSPNVDAKALHRARKSCSMSR